MSEKPAEKIAPNVYLIGWADGKVSLRSRDKRFRHHTRFTKSHEVWPINPALLHSQWKDQAAKFHALDTKIPLNEPRNYVTVQVIQGGLR